MARFCFFDTNLSINCSPSIQHRVQKYPLTPIVFSCLSVILRRSKKTCKFDTNTTISRKFSLAVFAKTNIITLAQHEIASLRHLVRGTTAAGVPPNRAAGKQHQNYGYLESRVGFSPPKYKLITKSVIYNYL